MLRAQAPSTEHLDAMLERLPDAQPSYTEIGGTHGERLPDGYAHDRSRVDLAPGAFDRAAQGLRSWQAHLGAGVEVYPSGAPVRPGTDVIVVARLGLLYALAPCRVVYVIDERDRFGFAYGTLPGHPERGEEAFVVERDANATAFTIVAFSRPAALAARLASPIARRVQRRVTRAYLEALCRYTTSQH